MNIDSPATRKTLGTIRMPKVLLDFRQLMKDIWSQDIAFVMVCGYLFFSYLRPQAIYPVLDFLPWTQICILTGLGYQVIKGVFKFEFLHFLLLLFCCIVVFSSFNSHFPDHSFDRLDIIFIWFVEVLFFTNCVTSKTQTKLMFSFFFLIIFKISFFGARTWTTRGFGFVDWGIAGPPGFFANSGELSLLLSMTAVMAIGYFGGRKKITWYHKLFSLTCIMTVLGASSRGGQLALVFGLLYIALLFRKIAIKHLIMGGLIILFLQNFIPAEQMKRFSEMGSDNTSQSRLEYWKAGVDMLDKYPITGIGYYSFPRYYERYYSTGQSIEGFLANRREVAHNSFVEIGSTLGYPGLFVYCWLIFYIFYMCRKTRQATKNISDDYYWINSTARGLQAATIVYLVGSFFMSVAFYPFLYLLLMTAHVLRKCSTSL